MATVKRRSSREGLSVQTLVAAAIASAVAAIVTSTFWRGGTIVTAAMTPVIVAIVKELVARPMQSELVRRPVERVRAVAPPTTGVRRFERRQQAPASARGFERSSRVPAHAGGRLPERQDAPPREAIPEPTAGDRALATGPIRTYSSRRRLRIGVALATGIVAFAIAFVALTVPELIFGGSVASKGNTTFFGGQSAKTARSNQSTTTSPTSTSPSSQSQTNSTTSTTPKTRTLPSEKAPTHTSPSQAAPPTQQAPSSGGGSSAPSTGSSPPSGGTSQPGK